MSPVVVQSGRLPRGQWRPRRAGFTLVELLVVIAIILIVSVASLPVIMPALNQRKVSTAALLLQAEINRARDTAIRANAPRGIRLLPDREGRFDVAGPTPAYTRMIAIEPGPDYSEGEIRGFISPAAALTQSQNDAATFANLGSAAVGADVLWRTVWESKHSAYVPGLPGATSGVPRSPTSWYWNVRQGDKLVIGDREWTIVGPMLVSPYSTQNTNNSGLDPTDRVLDNPERYINWGSTSNFVSTPTSNVTTPVPKEFLIVLDGIDNDGDGYTDEQFDGIDNDGDGITDPGFDGIDNDGDGYVDEPDEMLFTLIPGGAGETENETFPLLIPITPAEVAAADIQATSYSIKRRPVPAQGARELELPTGTAIDMTTWSAAVPERSRLPIDPLTGYIDIMVAPNGQMVQPIAGRTAPPPPAAHFYHFWITDVEDIVEPLVSPTNSEAPLLPINTAIFADPERLLRRERRLVSVNTRTGQIVTSTAENFEVPPPTGSALDSGYTSGNRAYYIGTPYRNAETGIKEAP